MRKHQARAKLRKMVLKFIKIGKRLPDIVSYCISAIFVSVLLAQIKTSHTSYYKLCVCDYIYIYIYIEFKFSYRILLE